MLSLLASLLLGSTVSANDAEECVYRVARNFRNIQSDAYRSNVLSSEIVEFLYETEGSLVRMDAATKEIIPGLATSWEYDSKNHSFVFHLNQSCRWSDGLPLIADDFVDGFRELYRHGVLPSLGGDLITGGKAIIEEGAAIDTLDVIALSDDTVHVGIVGDPSVALKYLSYILYSPLPSHVFNAEHYALTSPKRRTIGSFKVVTAAKDLIVLDKNPYYCSDQKITIDRVEVINRKNSNWVFSQFMAGRLDMMRYPSEKQLQFIKNNVGSHSQARVEIIDMSRQTYLILNPEQRGLVHGDIRNAIFSAIDYSSLVDRGNSIDTVRKAATTVFYDLANYNNYRYSPPTKSYQEGIDTLRIAMEKHGYSNKEPLRTSIITYPLERFEATAKMLSSMLRKAHFDIRLLKALSIDDVLKTVATGRFEMYFFSWTLDYTDPQSSLDGVLQIIEFLLKENGEGASSVELTEKFIDPIKASLAKLMTTDDQAERYKELQGVEKLLFDNGLVIPLFTDDSVIVVSPRMGALEGQFPYSRAVSFSDCHDEKSSD